MYAFEKYLNSLIVKNDEINENNIHNIYSKLLELSKLEKPIKNSDQLEYILLNYSFNDKILDFGSGNSILIVVLKFLGYNNIYGVDVIKNYRRDLIFKLSKFSSSKFYLIKEKLPFEDNFFDLVISNTVLEHVKNIDKYYSESHRVLKKNKKAYFIFPHRLRPYDSHTRTILIHYFPKILRIKFYDFFTKEGGEYYEDFLNLKTPYYHYKIANKYFSNINNISKKRIMNNSVNTYDGNIKIRLFYKQLIQIPFLGPIILEITYRFAQLSIILTK